MPPGQGRGLSRTERIGQGLSRRDLLGRGGAPDTGAGSIVLWMAGIWAIVLGWSAWMLSGSDPGFASLTLLLISVPWVIGFLASSVEHGEKIAFLDDAPVLVLPGLCAGLIGFLLHTGIDLAMFQPGAATLFFALMAVALAARDGTTRVESTRLSDPGALAPGKKAGSSRRAVGAAVAVGGLIGALLLVMLLVLPAARLGKLLPSARQGEKDRRWDRYVASPAYAAYAKAIDCYRLDGTAVEEQADELIRRVSNIDDVDLVIKLGERLRRRDPANAIAWHQLATLHYQRFALGGDPADLERAIADLRRAVAAYPTSPTKRLMLANLLERQAGVTGSTTAREAAAAELQMALELDAKRIYVSKPHRLTDEMRDELVTRIARLRRPVPTVSAPPQPPIPSP